MNKYLRYTLHYYRFELLLLALVLLLFDKAFFPDNAFFTEYIWPVNMICLGAASVGIFTQRETWIKWIKRVLLILSVAVPLFFSFISQVEILVELTLILYMVYYVYIFSEVLRQIFRRKETTLGIVFGSISGYLLLIVIGQFLFLTIEYHFPGSFQGLNPGDISHLYNQLSYFSMATVATVGYGDITPVSEAARLAAMFFAIIGQFYLVALVGMIVARYNDSSR